MEGNRLLIFFELRERFAVREEKVRVELIGGVLNADWYETDPPSRCALRWAGEGRLGLN